MTEDDKQNKTSKQTDPRPEFEAIYTKLTSDKVKKASDELFSADEKKLAEAFKGNSK
jgi:hypothetical protein